MTEDPAAGGGAYKIAPADRLEKVAYLNKRTDDDISSEHKRLAARLVEVDGTVHDIYTGLTIIGNGSTSHSCNVIALPQTGVSSLHALIQISPNGHDHFVEDLQSTNGSHYGLDLVAMENYRVYQIFDGKQLKFGPTTCRYEIVPLQNIPLGTASKATPDLEGDVPVERLSGPGVTMEEGGISETQESVQLTDAPLPATKPFVKKYGRPTATVKEASKTLEAFVQAVDRPGVGKGSMQAVVCLGDKKGSMQAVGRLGEGKGEYVERPGEGKGKKASKVIVDSDSDSGKIYGAPIDVLVASEPPLAARKLGKGGLVEAAERQGKRGLAHRVRQVLEDLEEGGSVPLQPPVKAEVVKALQHKDAREHSMDEDEVAENRAPRAQKVNFPQGKQPTTKAGKREATAQKPKVATLRKAPPLEEAGELTTTKQYHGHAAEVIGDPLIFIETVNEAHKRVAKAAKKKGAAATLVEADAMDAGMKAEPAKSAKKRPAKKTPNSTDVEGMLTSHSKRQRSLSLGSSEPFHPNPGDIVVLFTGISDDVVEELAKIVQSLGGRQVYECEGCTHLVTDKIRRTAKFLSSLTMGKNIVSIEWLKRCKKEGHFCDPTEFFVEDRAAEKKYDFKLLDSLNAAKRQDTRLFEGIQFYCTESVNPGAKDMEEIVVASGGTLLHTPPKLYKKDIIICADARDSESCKALRALGYKIQTAEFVLSSILHQKVDHDAHLLKSSKK